MKKHQTIILWIFSCLVVFLLGYFNSVTSPNAPLTGTVGLEGYKLSYRFDRIAVADTNTRIIFRSDNVNASGYIRFLPPYDTLQPVPLKKDGIMLVGFLPPFAVGCIVNYKGVIMAGKDTITIPARGFEGTLFRGKVPRQLSGTLVVLMILGILFSVRAALETFSPKPHLRRFSLLALACFGVYGIVLEPLVNSYLIGAVGHRIVQPQQIFSALGLSLTALWIPAVIFVFRKQYAKQVLYSAGLLTIVLFLLLYSPV